MKLYAVGDLARRFDVPRWKVMRLFEDGLVPEPPRLGHTRVLCEEDLPAVEAALRRRGYIVGG